MLKGLGSALVALIVGVLGKFAGGWETLLGNLVAVGASVCALAFSFLYQRYQAVLAASKLPSLNEGMSSPERAGYENLRRRLADRDGAAGRLYIKWLANFLDWVERYCGDREKANRSFFPHAFGLQMPSPLWTAPAFDRCLLLALSYPSLTIYVIWVMSGRVGPAEAALHLDVNFSAWLRFLLLLSLVEIPFLYWRFLRATGSRSIVWICIGVTFVAINIIVFDSTFTMFLTLAGAVASASSGAGAVVGVIAVASAVVGAGAGVFAIRAADKKARDEGWQGVFLALFSFVMSIFCIVSPYWLAPNLGWNTTGPLLMFLGLFTLLNAPFNWLSLGLTRALLRRGLELKGWWPLLLAVVDAALAVLIVAALSITLILGVQAFDSAAVLGGGKAVLSVADVLTGISDPKTAAEPEYWWVYALLLSTMIPSMINLAIGGMALMRGIPGLRPLMHRQLPAEIHVASFDRKWIALVLAAQDVGGVVLGIGAQALIFWLLFAYVLPSVGLGLLEMANDIAALDLPQRALTALLSAF